MVSCSRCGNRAVIDERCKEHFLSDFISNVKKTIVDHRLLSKDEKIMVAASGGKDSLCLIHVLNGLGYRFSVLVIDEGIAGYREKTIDDLKRFCDSLGIMDLRIKSFQDEYADSLDNILKKKCAGPCTECGTRRREMLERYSEGFDVIATGHNIDDESQAFLMNLFKSQLQIAARQGPVSGLKDMGFVRRVKPLYLCSEKETRLYTILNGIDVHFSECPYAVRSFRHSVGYELNKLEEREPGAKLGLIKSFLSMLPGLKEHYGD